MPHTVLIIEDEPDINQLLSRILTAAGCDTRQAFSGTEALLLVEKEIPDIILLDLMLPGLTGEELLKRLREEMSVNIPVLILSAKGSLADKVTLLKSGADDYIVKPFAPDEVIARVQAALRRAGWDAAVKGAAGRAAAVSEAGGRDAAVSEAAMLEAGGREILTYRNLRLEPEARKVIVSGQELELTAREYELLLLLLRNPGKVYSRESLYELIWRGGYYGENNTVNVHVSNLRKKIKEADPQEEYIVTVYGIGFKLG